MPELLTDEKVIIDFLLSLGWDGSEDTGYPLMPGPEIVDTPEKCVFITGTGGPGYITEEAALDAGTWQARTRGPTDDQASASSAAKTLDMLILRASFPTVIDGVRISNCYRFTNGPTPLGPDDGRRFEYICDYVMITGVPLVGMG